MAVALALACAARPNWQELPPLERATVPAPPAAWADDSLRAVAGAVVGVLMDCDSVPTIGAYVRVEGPDRRTADSLLVGDPPGQFTVGPLPPGRWRLRVLAIGFEPVELTLDLAAGRLDTLIVRLNDSKVLIADCLCPDGRSMASFCCPPTPPRQCR